MRLLFTLGLLFFGIFQLRTQEIQINYENENLNDVLLDLSNRYLIQISIDSDLSSLCQITIDKTFESIDQALDTIAEQCNFETQKINNVFTFRANPISSNKEPSFLFQGRILEKETLEPLPYSLIQTEDASFYTDQNGRFSFKSMYSEQRVQVKHLGYQIIDSILPSGNQIEVGLATQFIELEEILLNNTQAVYYASVGNETGKIKLNNIASQAVMGNNNNIIFDYLRLYPGVMAAGESVSDYVFWGSYAGQTEVIYDGITLFSNWGIYNDIGRVNPLMIKNIEVFKGGYNVDVGSRVGGALLIDSKIGNQNDFEGILGINSQTSNAYLSIPLSKEQSSLQLSARASYFNFSKRNLSDQKIIPDYNYNDFNLKWTTRLENKDRMEWTSLLSNDSYLEILERSRSVESYKKESSSLQIGNSLNYFKSWSNGGISSLSLSQSSYNSDLNVSVDFKEGVENVFEQLEGKSIWDNAIKEHSFKITHQFPLKNKQQFEFGLHWTQNQFSLSNQSLLRRFLALENKMNRLTFYGKDDFQLTPFFDLSLGIKVDALAPYNQLYIQPRLNGSLQLLKKWKLTFGSGYYNQFIGKVPVIDRIKDRIDLWLPLNNQDLNTLNSLHNIVGISRQSETLNVSVEAFYKTTQNLGRIFKNRDRFIFDNRKARTYGIDFYSKKRVQKHEFWISYSWGQIQETLPERIANDFYVKAQHSQQSEIKGVAIFNFDPLHFTISHVYGTGFPKSQRLEPNVLINNRSEEIPYARTDVSFQYNFNIQNLDLETGFSIINLFDRQNLRLNQSTDFPDDFTVTQTGIPFNPLIYLNIRF